MCIRDRPNDPLLQDRLYVNDGKGNFEKQVNALPDRRIVTTTLALLDVDQDGHQDIFVGAGYNPGRYPESGKNGFLINDGTGKFTNKITTVAPSLEQIGAVKDAQSIDLNNDNKLDLLVAGEWMPINCLLYTSPSPRDATLSRMPSSA